MHLICNLKFVERCVLDKKAEVKYGTVIHRSEGLLDCIHVDVWVPIKTASLGDHGYLEIFVDDSTMRYWVYPMR